MKRKRSGSMAAKRSRQSFNVDNFETSEYLDDEVLSCLVQEKYVRFEDLCNLQQVNKKCGFYADRYYSRLKSLDISKFYGVSRSSSSKRREIAKSNAKFTTLLGKVAKKCPNLQSFKGIGFLSSEVSDAYTPVPNDYGFLDKYHFKLLADMPNLTSVGFNSCLIDSIHFENYLRHFSTNLTSLEIFHYSFLDFNHADEILTRAFSNLHLKHFKLTWGINLNGKFLEAVDGRNLESLNLEGCNFLAVNIMHLLDRCPNLLELNLTFSAIIYDDDWMDYCNYNLMLCLGNLTTLRSLTMNHLGHTFTDDDMIDVISNLTNLTQLTLVHCHFITDQFLQMMRTELTKLQILHIDRRFCSPGQFCELFAQLNDLKKLFLYGSNFDWGINDCYNSNVFHIKARMKLNRFTMSNIIDLCFGAMDEEDATEKEETKDRLISFLSKMRRAQSVRIYCDNFVDYDPLLYVAQYCPFTKEIVYLAGPNGLNLETCQKLAQRCKNLNICTFLTLCHNDDLSVACLRALLDRGKKLNTIGLCWDDAKRLWHHAQFRSIRHKITVIR